MKVVKAAISFNNLRTGNHEVVVGNSHSDIIAKFAVRSLPSRFRENEVSGFVLDDGSFVDRATAYVVAEKACQVMPECPKGILFSEFCDYSRG